MRVTRLDYTGRLDSSKRTAQGGLKLPAYVTRVGVLTYKNPDGTVTRELRHPDDVFKADSLATLAGAPVTIGHPGKVTPDNHGRHSAGHVGDVVEPKEEKYVATSLYVQDAKAVKGVESGNLLELSCGYDCDAIPEKGEYNGEKYDARQTNIVYNHVALLPKDHGRAGSDVRIRFDGLTDDEVSITKLTPLPAMNEFEKKIAELSVELAKATARADAAEQAASVASKSADAFRGEVDALKSKLTVAEDPARFDAAVTSRVKLHEDAKAFGIEAKGSARDIMVACLSKVDATFRADSNDSDEYIRGRFDTEVKLTASAAQSASKVRQDAQGAADTGAGEKDLVAEAQARYNERSQNSWKKA